MADKMVQPDKDAKPVSGETAGAMASGGESQGKPFPNDAAGDKSEQAGLTRHGGQTEMGYHGSGQLGGKKVGNGNQNAPAKGDDKP
jgi:hypothetical protein